MEQQTYTQEQLAVACKSYSDEVRKLLDVKGGLMLDIFNLKKQLAELQKQNADLRKLNSEQKVKVSDTTEVDSSNGVHQQNLNEKT